MISNDGDTWTSVPHGLGPRNFNDVVYANNMFVAVSSDVQGGLNAASMYSYDGTTWTLGNAPRGDWQSVAYGNGVFVSVASSTSTTKVMTSTDGINWTNRTPASATNVWRGVTFGNGIFVAVSISPTSGDPNVMTSTDGITWTSRTPPGNTNTWAVAYGNGLFAAVGLTGSVMTSPDGINWTNRVAPAANDWKDIAYANGKFVAVSNSGTGNRVMSSTDGITWISEASANDYSWTGLTNGNGKFVAVSDSGTGNRVVVSSLTVGPVSAQQSLVVNPTGPAPEIECWQNATFNPATCQWVVTGEQPAQPGASPDLSQVYDKTQLPGYGVVTSPIFNFSPGGWAGLSVPAGKVVLGANIISSGDSHANFAVFRPAGPGEVFPHYTYGAGEYGWVLQARNNEINYGVQIEVCYAEPVDMVDGALLLALLSVVVDISSSIATLLHPCLRSL
jgi:hypothetical protein